MRWLTRIKGGQRGLSLIETVVALGILGFIGVAFMSALSTSFKATDIVDERVRAENLARSVLEAIRSKPYCDSYIDSGNPTCYASVTAPYGYSYTITTTCSTPDSNLQFTTTCTPDNNIQLSTARAFRDSQLLSELSDLKARR